MSRPALHLVILSQIFVGACGGADPVSAPHASSHAAHPAHALPVDAAAPPPPATVAAPAPSAAPRYTCPMHRGYVVDKPGACPMCGMNLVAVAPEPARRASPPPSSPEVHEPLVGEVLDLEARRLPYLRTVAAGRRALGGELRTVGRVAIDERRVVRVQPRFEGFIEGISGLFVGKAVRRGELLATVYSPELLAAQRELLLARRGGPALAGAGLPDGAAAAAEKLALLGMPPSEIAAIEKSGVPRRTTSLRAPRAGVITQKNAVAGGRVGPDAPAFEITDLSHLWVLADVYEGELPRIRPGLAARVTLPYWPGRQWQGQVTFIAPMVDDKTRTVRVRIELGNPRGELRPEMFAEVVIAAATREALAVPEDAVVETGTRSVVFVDRGQGRVEQRAIQPGARSGGFVEVRGGLAEGERVAVGASFLLDSEARLRAQSAAPAGTP